MDPARVSHTLAGETLKDSQEAAEAVQRQLDSVSKWCHDIGSLIDPDKAQTLWCTFDKRPAGKSKSMPAGTVDGAVVERTSHLRSVLKAMAAKGIEHFFLLYQSVGLSVTDHRLGLTTVAQTNLLKLDRVQNKAMGVILGTTKNTPTETMKYMLDLPPVQIRKKMEQVKAYTSVPSKIPTTHLTNP